MTAIPPVEIWKPKGPFPLWLDNLKDSTLGWSEKDKWRYLQVLAHGWHSGGLIPSYDAAMSDLCGLKRRANFDLIRSKLIIHPDHNGYLTHHRLLKDIKKAHNNSKGGRRAAIKRAATGTEGGTETELNGPSLTPSPSSTQASPSSPKKKPTVKKKVPLPDDFEPDFSEAEKRGLSAEDEWHKFQTNHTEKRRKFSDWSRAWVNWCIKGQEFRDRDAKANRNAGADEDGVVDFRAAEARYAASAK